MMLIRLTYFSRNRLDSGTEVKTAASRRFSRPRLPTICATASPARCSATTAGLCRRLEGAESKVSAAFERILRDQRHRDVSLVTMQAVAERRFPELRDGLRLPRRGQQRSVPPLYRGRAFRSATDAGRPALRPDRGGGVGSRGNGGTNMDEKERYERGLAQAAQGAGRRLCRPVDCRQDRLQLGIPGFHHPLCLGRDLDPAAFRRADAAHPGDRHHHGARQVGGVPPARARRADRRRLLRRRHQGDHPAADDLLRRAGRQPCLQGGGRGRQGARQAAGPTVRTGTNRPHFGLVCRSRELPRPQCRFTRSHTPMAGFNVRKEMPEVELSQRGIQEAISRALLRSGLRAAAPRDRPLARSRLGGL